MAGSGITLIERGKRFPGRTAVIDGQGHHSYGELLEKSLHCALVLRGRRKDLKEARVGFLVPRDFSYCWMQWGIWRAGGVAVPLSEAHPLPEMEYALRDAEAELLCAHPDFMERLSPLAKGHGIRLIAIPEEKGEGTESADDLPEIEGDRKAMILYTSGSTGRPKGVVVTHSALKAQIKSMTEAWEWRKEDHILNVLPLHHVHGIVNILNCAQWNGAICEFLPRFDPGAVWKRFQSGEISLFMAVPTIYVRLIEDWESAEPETQKRLSEACGNLRLMVSGSAALPAAVLEQWRQISGHTLLERYGMTEFGMALSNPLHGERRPGFVGKPLPGVAVKLVDEAGKTVPEGEAGEIAVRGDNVFRQYWKKPLETASAFRDGWFLSGDIGIVENEAYRILGRKNVDIVKTGGYKVSALEIENALRQHPAIREIGVVGIADEKWGERIAAAVVLKEESDLDLEALRRWARDRLASYKIPTRLKTLDALPRNAMGKITKLPLKKVFYQR